MAKKAEKFFVVRARWEKTWWTSPDDAHPKPVSKKAAQKALAQARDTYPDEHYKLQEVKP